MLLCRFCTAQIGPTKRGPGRRTEHQKHMRAVNAAAYGVAPAAVLCIRRAGTYDAALEAINEMPWRTCTCNASGSRAASSVGWFDGDPVDDDADCCAVRARINACIGDDRPVAHPPTDRPGSPGSMNCDGTDGRGSVRRSCDGAASLRVLLALRLLHRKRWGWSMIDVVRAGTRQGLSRSASTTALSYLQSVCPQLPMACLKTRTAQQRTCANSTTAGTAISGYYSQFHTHGSFLFTPVYSLPP
jgi:hypothetical protein